MRSSHREEAIHAGPTGSVTVTQITDQERQRLLHVLLGGAESAEAWLRAQIVLLNAQAIAIEEISEITGVDAETVRVELRSAGSLPDVEGCGPWRTAEADDR